MRLKVGLQLSPGVCVPAKPEKLTVEPAPATTSCVMIAVPLLWFRQPLYVPHIKETVPVIKDPPETIQPAEPFSKLPFTNALLVELVQEQSAVKAISTLVVVAVKLIVFVLNSFPVKLIPLLSLEVELFGSELVRVVTPFIKPSGKTTPTMYLLPMRAGKLYPPELLDNCVAIAAPSGTL